MVVLRLTVIVSPTADALVPGRGEPGVVRAENAATVPAVALWLLVPATCAEEP